MVLFLGGLPHFWTYHVCLRGEGSRSLASKMKPLLNHSAMLLFPPDSALSEVGQFKGIGLKITPSPELAWMNYSGGSPVKGHPSGGYEPV